jgi:hypothetical protein
MASLADSGATSPQGAPQHGRRVLHTEPLRARVTLAAVLVVAPPPDACLVASPRRGRATTEERWRSTSADGYSALSDPGGDLRPR